MKNIKIKTEKATFYLIDMPTDTKEIQNIYLNGISWQSMDGHWNTWYTEDEEETLYFVSYFKGISEEQASEIVFFGDEFTFKDYTSAKDKLFKVLKSKGIFLFENPIKLPHSLDYCSSRWTYYGYEVREYQKAEEKTFYNPTIYAVVN